MKEINIDVKLMTNPNRICTEFNNFFTDFVQEISQMFHPPFLSMMHNDLYYKGDFKKSGSEHNQ